MKYKILTKIFKANKKISSKHKFRCMKTQIESKAPTKPIQCHLKNITMRRNHRNCYC